MSEVTTEKYKSGVSYKRDSNIELFRIITMLLIVAHHYVVNSGLTEGPIAASPMSFSSIFLLLFGAWGKIGINCFVLITGYFMCKSRITAKKFFKLFLEIMFYRLVIGVIFFITGYAPFTIKSFIKMVLPITSVAQNFTGTYLIFFLCIPFLNILVTYMNERQHIKLLLILGFTYVFFGTVKLMSVTMNYVSWYAVLYFVASYIRLYPKRIFDNKRFWLCMTLISVILSSCSVVICSWLGAKLGRNLWYFFVTDSNTFLALITGISSFMLFKNINIKYNRFINAVSATTFGVLLIHANSDAMRQWLWGDVLDNVGMYNSAWMPLHAIVSVVVIFAVCSAIDYCRIKFVETPFFNLFDKHWKRISEKYQKIEDKVCNKLNIGK